MANYESTKEAARQPSLNDLRILARALNSTYDELIDGEESAEQADNSTIKTLEYVVMSLVSTMAAYRPHEAAAMASAMRGNSETLGVDQSLLSRLLEVLDARAEQGAREDQGPDAGAAPPRSAA